jgi:ubiquinone/menaquinone biosynthesis C-methylase UbiE/uncharacterized protein YbaR (Trm112 family)
MAVAVSVLEILRCPVCAGTLADDGASLTCQKCGRVYAVEDGIPRMLDDALPGIREKRLEIDGWVEKARNEAWYEPDDEVDAALPYVVRDLGWTDSVWHANEFSFTVLLDRYVEPGMRILELGAAKCWGAQHLIPLGCEYVGTDILTDAKIGLGRGAFYEERVGPFARVQADGEHLPFADESFDLTYCAATLHHALDLDRMVKEMARVTRPGGVVAGLNEGTRAPWRTSANHEQAEEIELGINEHVHTLWAYLWSFSRVGLVIDRVEQAEGYRELASRNIAGKLLRLPGGRAWSMLWAQNAYGYSGVSIYARKPGRRRRR